MFDEKLEKLAQQIIERAQEIGADSATVSWWFGDDQQERSFFHSPDAKGHAMPVLELVESVK